MEAREAQLSFIRSLPTDYLRNSVEAGSVRLAELRDQGELTRHWRLFSRLHDFAVELEGRNQRALRASLERATEQALLRDN